MQHTVLHAADAFLSGGWAIWKDLVARVDFKGAFGWVEALHKHKLVRVPAKDAPMLLKKLYNHVLPPLDAPEELALMRTLKTALDPKGILNPGKVIAN